MVASRRNLVAWVAVLGLSSPMTLAAGQIEFPSAPQTRAECSRARETAMQLPRQQHAAAEAALAQRNQVQRQFLSACVASRMESRQYWACVEPYDREISRLHAVASQHFAERDRLQKIVDTAERQCDQVARANEHRVEQEKAREAELARQKREQLTRQEDARRAAERDQEAQRRAEAEHERIVQTRQRETESQRQLQQQQQQKQQAEAQRQAHQRTLSARLAEATSNPHGVAAANAWRDRAASVQGKGETAKEIVDAAYEAKAGTALRNAGLVGVNAAVSESSSALVDAAYAKRNDAFDDRVASIFSGANALRAANGAVNPVASAVADESMKRAESMAQQITGDMKAVTAQIDGFKVEPGQTRSTPLPSGTPVVVAPGADRDPPPEGPVLRRGQTTATALFQDAAAQADATARRDAEVRRIQQQGDAESLLRLAERQSASGQTSEARQTMLTLARRFPDSPYAAAVQRQLAGEARQREQQEQAQREAAAARQRAAEVQALREAQAAEQSRQEMRQALQQFQQAVEQAVQQRNERKSGGGGLGGGNGPCPPGRNFVNGSCVTGVAQ